MTLFRSFDRLQLAKNGNSPWGGLDSGNGEHYVVLQRTGTTLQQIITGLKIGRAYRLSFLTSKRPGNPEAKLRATVDGTNLFGMDLESDKFMMFSAVFEAHLSGVAHITFTNVSPDGDNSVLIDDIQVTLQRDCGDGAVCVETDGQPFTCHCRNGFEGGDSVGSPATCSRGQATIDELVDGLSDVQTETENLAASVLGIQREVADVSSRVASLEADQSALATIVANVNASVHDINTDFSAFKMALKSALSSVISNVTVGQPKSPGSQPQAPSVEAVNGDLRLSVDQGNKVMVNEDSVALETDVKEAIQRGVIEALSYIADQL